MAFFFPFFAETVFPLTITVPNFLEALDFFLAGIGEDDFIDLPDELVEQFAEQFRQPEVFVNVGGRIIAYPVAEEPVQDGMSY